MYVNDPIFRKDRIFLLKEYFSLIKRIVNQFVKGENFKT